MPKLSVVTISYNQAPYLRRCIESVLGQTGVDVEYIVVDPGSTDGSREIIREYSDRIARTIFEPDAGPADGLNKGLAASTGDYFYYLNSDDMVAPGAFAEAVQLLDATGVDVVYGNGLVIDEDDKVIRRLVSAPRMTPRLYARGLAVVVQQSTFLRTAKLREIGGFNVENRTCWDGEVLFDLACRGATFRRVWRDWGLFRIYPESISGSGRLIPAYERDQQRMAAKVLPDRAAPLQRLWTRFIWVALRASDVRRLVAQVARPAPAMR
jgi:Glycosyltransferases involved in cell wall biogenesis